jgi:hypothetical protein
MALGLAMATMPSASRALTLGLDAYGPLGSPDPGVSGPWIRRAGAERASIIRVGIQWSAVAPKRLPKRGFNPADPGSPYYNWGPTDAVLRNLATGHFTILIVIDGAPRWAEGRDRPRGAPPGTWRPSPGAFGRFARAAALRYSGHFTDPLRPGYDLPRVRYWEAWNEPNLSFYLTPQWTRSKHGYAAASPGIYRQLLNDFYAAVKRVSSEDVVVGGATAPFGDLSPSLSNNARMQPVPFVEDLLCLHGSRQLQRSRCPHPAHLDVLDHHPYDITGPYQHAVNAGDVSVPDMGKLARLVRAARRYRTVLPGRPKHIWATELGWSSRPPNRQGVPLERQARWLEEALYMLWRQGVSVACWLQIADDPGRGGLDAGLYFAQGRPKPAARAFLFPFVVVRRAHDQARVWVRSPAAGALLIERRQGHRWVTVRRVRIRRGGIFYGSLKLRAQPILRARVGQSTSLNWAGA